MTPEAFKTPKEKLIAWLATQIAFHQPTVNDFAKTFRERPGRAFDGCDGAIESAAAIDVFTSAKFDLEHGCSLEDMADQAIKTLLNRAIEPQRSSSTTSTMLHLFKTKAWAEVAREARHLIPARER